MLRLSSIPSIYHDSWVRLPLLLCYKVWLCCLQSYQQLTSSSSASIRSAYLQISFLFRFLPLSDTFDGCLFNSSEFLSTFYFPSDVLSSETKLSLPITWALSIINSFNYFATAELWDSIYSEILNKVRDTVKGRNKLKQEGNRFNSSISMKNTVHLPIHLWILNNKKSFPVNKQQKIWNTSYM